MWVRFPKPTEFRAAYGVTKVFQAKDYNLPRNLAQAVVDAGIAKPLKGTSKDDRGNENPES